MFTGLAQEQKPKMGDGTDSFMRASLSGGAAGFSEVLSGQPFDTIKTRMQTAPRGFYSGFVDCTLKTIRTDGLRALYSGSAPAMTRAVGENMVAFTVNESLKKMALHLKQHPSLWSFVSLTEAEAEQIDSATDETQLSLPVLCGIGAAAGFIHTIITNPAEVVKCRLQVQSNANATGILYKNSFDCFTQLVTKEGPAALWAGWAAFAARETPFYMLFFGAYEAICLGLQTRQTIQTSHNVHIDQGPRKREDLSTPEILLAGGLAGCAAWAGVIPADVVKTQMQTASGITQGPIAVGWDIYRREGLFRGLYRGSTAIMLRAFPANAATFMGFEMARRHIPESW